MNEFVHWSRQSLKTPNNEMKMRGKNTVIQWHVERVTEGATTGHPFQGAFNQRVKLDLSFFFT